MILALIFVFLFSVTGCRKFPDLSGEFELLQNVLIEHKEVKPVGFRISSKLKVVHKGLDVYLLKLDNPVLEVLSQGTFKYHSSGLNTGTNDPFLVEMESGVIRNLHLSKSDSLSLRNIKRAVASLFQFQITEAFKEEIDSSGNCNVKYSVEGQRVFKVKESCTPAPLFQSGIWGGISTSKRETYVNLSSDKTRVKSISMTESHSIVANFADAEISSVSSSLSINSTGGVTGNPMIYNDEVVLQTLIEIGGQYDRFSVLLEPEMPSCAHENCPLLYDVVSAESSALDKYGKAFSAAAVLRITEAMRRSDQKNVLDVLNNKKFKKILPVLMDCAGSSHSEEIHQAVLRRLKINTDRYNLDLTERYLWSLSMSPLPSINITKDVLHLMKEKHKDSKLQSTLVLTAAALAQKVALAEDDPNHSVVKDVADTIKKNLNSCSPEDENCRQLNLKALGHMGNPYNKEILIKYATDSTKKSSARAMRALFKLGPTNWDDSIIETAEKVLNSNEADASARIVALELLLSAQPNYQTINMISEIIFTRTPASKELATLALAKLKNFAERDSEASELVEKALKGMNWNISAVGGMSTSFKRIFGPIGFLSTDQELSGGVLKQGYVNIHLLQGNTSHTIFTLGLFASGLGSFVSQNEVDSNEGGDDEEMTAGMELEVLGVELRPFVFFSGSGELMGHIWSGSASSDTAAYQAAILVGLSETSLAIGSAGILADLHLSSAASVQLSGEAEASIWNRNARSVVRNMGAILLRNHITLESELVRVSAEAELSSEPRLLLSSIIDFSGNTALCLLLDQPPSYIKYRLVNREKIKRSKQKVEKSLVVKKKIPGRSYALNKKNSDMCSVLLS